MKLNVISKTALAVTLMISQINYDNHSSVYYEDDSDFELVSSAFTNGWGWGLNKARAECSEGSEFSCMTIVAEPMPEYETMGGYEPYPQMPEDTSTGSTGGSGGSTTTTTTQTEPQFTPLQVCNLEALERKADCYNKAEILFQASIVGCTYIGISGMPIVGIACAGIATVAYNDQKSTCDYNYQKDLYICEQTHS